MLNKKGKVATKEERLRIWDVETGTSQPVLAPKGGRITRAALSPEGGVVAVASTTITFPEACTDEVEVVFTTILSPTLKEPVALS